MVLRTSQISLLCTIATTGLIAVLVADEIHKTGTDTGWRQHALNRPKPPVAEPVGPNERPKDAIVLFDGANLDAWRGKGGGAAEWKIEDGAFVVTPGKGAIHTK